MNLTDGLDGLAILPVVFVAAGLGVFSYVSGDVRFADYLHVPYIAYNSEVTIVCAAMIGSGLGFLWYNAHPAQKLYQSSYKWARLSYVRNACY